MAAAGIGGPNAIVIEEGTVLVCKEDLEVFEDVFSWHSISDFPLGSVVVAAGPPVAHDGFLMVPIKPSGAIEAGSLRKALLEKASDAIHWKPPQGHTPRSPLRQKQPQFLEASARGTPLLQTQVPELKIPDRYEMTSFAKQTSGASDYDTGTSALKYDMSTFARQTTTNTEYCGTFERQTTGTFRPKVAHIASYEKAFDSMQARHITSEPHTTGGGTDLKTTGTTGTTDGRPFEQAFDSVRTAPDGLSRQHCQLCGSRMGWIFGIIGLGIRKCGHEQRCVARKRAAARSLRTAVGNSNARFDKSSGGMSTFQKAIGARHEEP